MPMRLAFAALPAAATGAWPRRRTVRRRCGCAALRGATAPESDPARGRESFSERVRRRKTQLEYERVRQQQREREARQRWEALILEFEQRAARAAAARRDDSVARTRVGRHSLSSSSSSATAAGKTQNEDQTESATAAVLAGFPPSVIAAVGKRTPERFRMLPVVEMGFFTAATMCLWYAGRIMRLDALLLLFYPLPMFIMSMRWGISTGMMTLACTLLFVLFSMGPLYALSYLFNTGMMASALSVGLWYRWHWLPTVALGALAKALGLALQFGMMSVYLRVNSFKLLTVQVKNMWGQIIAGMVAARRLVPGAPGTPPTSPSVETIQVLVAALIITHSFLHVLLTQLGASMILLRLERHLTRSPRLAPLLQWLKQRADASSSSSSAVAAAAAARRQALRDEMDADSSASSR